MINVNTQVFDAIKNICENVGNNYPSDWATLPAIQYTEEENRVHEWTDDSEGKAYLRYRIDIWHNRNASEYAIQVDSAISSIGLVRTSCQDVADPSGLKHKVMRYEGVIDTETQFVYHA